ISHRPRPDEADAPPEPCRGRPTITYISTVLAYSSAGMIVDAVNSVTRAPVWVRSTSVMSPPITAASTVAHDGPPVARGTWLHSWWPGSRLSLDIDQMSRPFVTMMTNPHAKIDTQTKIRNSFCTTPPSTSCTISATGAELAVAAETDFVA